MNITEEKVHLEESNDKIGPVETPKVDEMRDSSVQRDQTRQEQRATKVSSNNDQSVPKTGLKVNSIRDDLYNEIKSGNYKIQIAPSDLVDFGGQRCFDMTHQFFIQKKGSFVLLFDGRNDLWEPRENDVPAGGMVWSSVQFFTLFN